MKEIKVIVKDKNTLELVENAEKGDIINLLDIEKVDASFISEIIEKEKSLEFNKRLNEEIDKLKSSLKLEKENEVLKNKEELERKYLEEINGLKNNVKNSDILKTNALTELKLNYENELNKLKVELSNCQNELKNEKEKTISEIKEAIFENDKVNEKKMMKLSEELMLTKQKSENDLLLKEKELREEFAKEIEKKNNEYNALRHDFEGLKFRKQSLNNKEIGEDLESYCNDMAHNLMQIGFDNCSWDKDNTSVKEENETKGTKADFIFKIFATNEKKEEECLSSICLEMKNEALESENKKKNQDHYQKLDKDRIKKNCKYAVLVSNLESDNENIKPIYKVAGYDDMYVVRPQYMTIFLTIITSLTNKFREILIADKNAKLDLLSKQEFIEKFESLKNTYLDKPLEIVASNIENIKKFNNNIYEQTKKIESSCDDIVKRYIEEIKNKIDKFVENMIKEYKKLEKSSK